MCLLYNNMLCIRDDAVERAVSDGAPAVRPLLRGPRGLALIAAGADTHQPLVDVHLLNRAMMIRGERLSFLGSAHIEPHLELLAHSSCEHSGPTIHGQANARHKCGIV